MDRYGQANRRLLPGSSRSRRIPGRTDVEGAVLEEIRRRFGYEVPIVVTLDPHANITRKMIESKALLLPSKLYPHTDTYETGEKAAQLLKDLLDQKISL